MGRRRPWLGGGIQPGHESVGVDGEYVQLGESGGAFGPVELIVLHSTCSTGNRAPHRPALIGSDGTQEQIVTNG